MAVINLNHLPREILEEIFSFLPGNCLLMLTEVCKDYNEIIGSRPNLMRKINLDWYGKHSKTLLASKRKYRHLTILEKGSMRPLEKFLSLNTRSLVSLQLFLLHLSVSNFACILDYAKDTLEEILLNSVRFNKNVEATPISLPKLKTIEFCGTGSFIAVINCFKNCTTVETVELKNESDDWLHKAQIQMVSECLGSFSGLKNLCLGEEFGQLLFKKRYLIMAAKFHLEKFETHPLGDFYNYNLGKFLKMQRNTLKILKLEVNMDTDFIELILRSKVLKELTLKNSKIDLFLNIAVQNTSIETLEIKAKSFLQDDDMDKGVIEVFKHCSGLKKLDFKNYYITSDIALAIAGLKFLKHLEFNIYILESVSLLNVKRMSIHGDHDKVLELIQMNPQLKRIKIDKSLLKHPDYEKTINESSIEIIEFWPEWFF